MPGLDCVFRLRLDHSSVLGSRWSFGPDHSLAARTCAASLDGQLALVGPSNEIARLRVVQVGGQRPGLAAGTRQGSMELAWSSHGAGMRQDREQPWIRISGARRRREADTAHCLSSLKDLCLSLPPPLPRQDCVEPDGAVSTYDAALAEAASAALQRAAAMLAARSPSRDYELRQAAPPPPPPEPSGSGELQGGAVGVCRGNGGGTGACACLLAGCLAWLHRGGAMEMAQSSGAAGAHRFSAALLSPGARMRMPTAELPPPLPPALQGGSSRAARGARRASGASSTRSRALPPARWTPPARPRRPQCRWGGAGSLGGFRVRL